MLLPLILILTTLAWSNTRDSNHLPIGHCYHWLEEATNSKGYLRYKYDYADKNNGEMTFYTNGSDHGAVAGPGLYCGKTPGDSTSYGDRIIRIEFVDDVVLFDEVNNVQYCGKDGAYYKSTAECTARPWDVKFYNGGGAGNTAWYVIRNPQAVARWSASSDELINDLNAEKKFEGSAYAVQADNVIKLIPRDRLYRKLDTIENGNARISIVRIVRDAAKVAQIPPLTLIAQVSNYQGKELLPAEKNKIYLDQYTRALADTKLGFSDFLASFKGQTELEKIFIGVLKKASLDNVNPVLLLQGFDKYFAEIKPDIASIRTIWKAALLSSSDLNSIVETNLEKDGEFAKNFVESLPQDLQTLASKNLVPFLKLIDRYTQAEDVATISPVYSELMKGLLLTNDFTRTFDSLSNGVLDKATVLGQILARDFKTINDPMALAMALDKAKLANKAPIIARILKLPLDKGIAYQLLDNFQSGRIKLPAFYSEKLFISKLIEKSLAERKTLKTPTNAFRMIYSGLFLYYQSKLKADSDQEKAAQDISNIFLELASTLTSPELREYRYITLQNGSLFLSNLKYKNHPLEAAFEHYKKGDPKYDALFEEIVTESHDGSVVQFLAFQDAKRKEANQLLHLIITHLDKGDFDKDPNFALTQAEKKQWKNYIAIRYYSKDGRVPTDVCHIVTVKKLYDEKLKSVLPKADYKKLANWDYSCK